MADTGAPHFIPYVEPTDLVREYPAADEASAFAVAAGLDAAGGLVAVHSAFKSDVFSWTSSGLTDVPDLTLTFTPASADHRMLVFWNVPIAQSGDDGNNVRMHVLRNSVQPFQSDGADGWTAITTSEGLTDTLYKTGSGIDTPNTTAALTYKIQVSRAVGTGYVGRGRTFPGQNVSSLLVMEVKV